MNPITFATGLIGVLGGEGQIVEADETYHGKKSGKPPTHNALGIPYPKGKGGAKRAHKRSIVSLVERGGKIKSFHVDRADKVTVANIIVNNVAKESELHTDESRLYTGAEAHVKEHHSVKHASGEYVRGNVHNNSAEGYFGLFKRGMKGIYQHCGESHLHRYLSEFDFRYNHREKLGYNDEDRATALLKGFVGKRLTYQTTGERNVC